MSKRLQVLMDDEELARLQGAAELEGMTVADWVRRALNRALQHVAVLRSHDIDHIMTLDRGFDRFAGVHASTAEPHKRCSGGG